MSDNKNVSKRRTKRQNSNIFEMLTKTQIIELREAFNLLDANSDTFICKEDLKSFTSSIGSPFSADEINNMMQEADGQMNFMTFLTLIGEKLSMVDDEKVILQAFNEFREGGVIKKSLVSKYMSEYGSKMTQEDIDFFFKGCVEDDIIDYKKLTSIIKHGEVIQNEQQ